MATSLLVCDIQHSVLAAAGCIRAYTPYGASPVACGPTLAYCGQPRDRRAGTYHLGNGHRVFNPVQHRFYSSDAQSPFGKGGINAYGYCSGDPVNYQDRNGRNRLPNRAMVSAGVLNPPQVSGDSIVVGGAAVAVVVSSVSLTQSAHSLGVMYVSASSSSPDVKSPGVMDWAVGGVAFGVSAAVTLYSAGVRAYIGVGIASRGNDSANQTSIVDIALSSSALVTSGLALTAALYSRKRATQLTLPAATSIAVTGDNSSVGDRQRMLRDDAQTTV